MLQKNYFNARHMISQRFDIILIAKILRKIFLSFFQTRLGKRLLFAFDIQYGQDYDIHLFMINNQVYPDISI